MATIETGISITERDAELFQYLNRLRFLTINQIGALFYGGHDGYELDVKRARSSLSHRVGKLVRNGYLSWGYTSYNGGSSVKSYFLGRAAINYLKDVRALEDVESPRYLQRKSRYAWDQGAHDLAMSNFLINLILLDRLHSDFSLNHWLADRDCHFYVQRGQKPRIFDPDLYLVATNKDFGPAPYLFELDGGSLSTPVLIRKFNRLFEYFESFKWIADLGSELFPRVGVIALNERRLETINQAIKVSRKEYRARDRKAVASLTFWLATFDRIDLFCIEKGLVSGSPLGPVWSTNNGDNNTSLFDPK